jgi:methyl-accepting chemotaxis protein
VAETTSTIEEVKQTADLANQKAKAVSDGAQQAVVAAQSGQKAVEDVMSSMHRVQEQMESIADNVVRLSEQSQAIGEIIVTVNDIAEQSNILAVNASIEAAKAAEHGKGFGVVAQEIRNLADQSKQATAQVRTILTDIQRGVSASVMATEQGNRAVSESMKQSTEAGESIRVLTDTTVQSARAATQIASSSQQQVVGMNQIAKSMEEIKQASQQNLQGTQQAETAAKSLNELGKTLKQLAEKYQV